MTSSFILNTRGEFLKCRSTPVFWLTVGGAAFIPLVNIIKCLARPDYFAPKMQINSWTMFLEFNWQIAAGFLLTMYVVLASSLIVQIEYSNGTWKQVYTSPRSYLDIFLSKFLVLNSMIILCFILFNFFIIAGGRFIELVNHGYSFRLGQLPIRYMVIISIKMYFSVLAMMVIQYCISLQLKNFVIPIGIGLGLFTVGFMIRQWEHINYYPYLYPFLVYFSNPGLPADTADQTLTHSIGWALLGLIGGYLLVVKRRAKG